MSKVVKISAEQHKRLLEIQEILKRKRGARISLRAIVDMAIYRYWKEVTKE